MQPRTIYHSDKQEIVDLFVGKSVTKVSNDSLILSDGTKLTIIGNDGGCSCGNGDYYITELNECENIIMNVEYLVDDENQALPGYGERYSIFVYADNRKINLLTVEGYDNGYYGYGFWIEVEE